MDAPTRIHYRKQSRELTVAFATSEYAFSAEFLRVHSPSAEVQGHGPGQETLQTGKKHVAITEIQPTGNYGIRLTFDDGHDSGIYSWRYLQELGEQQEALWQRYLAKLKGSGGSREPLIARQFHPAR